MNFLPNLETPKPFKTGRWQLWKDGILSQSPNFKSQWYLTRSNRSHLFNVLCVCLSVVALFYQEWQTLHLHKVQSQLCLGGLGVEMQGRRKGLQKYKELKGLVRWSHLIPMPSPKCSVNVLLIQGWLSLRWFQWILYNHVVMHVALGKHHSNLPLPHVTSRIAMMTYGLHESAKPYRKQPKKCEWTSRNSRLNEAVCSTTCPSSKCSVLAFPLQIQSLIACALLAAIDKGDH